MRDTGTARGTRHRGQPPPRRRRMRTTNPRNTRTTRRVRGRPPAQGLRRTQRASRKSRMRKSAPSERRQEAFRRRIRRREAQPTQSPARTPAASRIAPAAPERRRRRTASWHPHRQRPRRCQPAPPRKGTILAKAAGVPSPARTQRLRKEAPPRKLHLVIFMPMSYAGILLDGINRIESRCRALHCPATFRQRRSVRSRAGSSGLRRTPCVPSRGCGRTCRRRRT